MFAIGHQGVFRLRRWSSRIHTGFLGPRATWDAIRESQRFRLQGYHPLCRPFPKSSAINAISYSLPGQQLRLDGPATPITQRLLAITRNRFGLFPFRSPLLRESRLLSLPVGTEMFHFPTFPPHAVYIRAWVTGLYYSPVGFPHSEILGSQFGYQLPEAYRRFLRPSSAPGAKAFTVCPYQLGNYR